jgi:hypothetical protein
VPPGVGDLLARIEKGIELLATTRNTFAKPPGPEDAAMLVELSGIFPEVDRAVQADLNAIAVAVKNWRREQLGTLPGQATTRRVRRPNVTSGRQSEPVWLLRSPMLETDRLVLRPPAPEDFDA